MSKLFDAIYVVLAYEIIYCKFNSYIVFFNHIIIFEYITEN